MKNKFQYTYKRIAGLLIAALILAPSLVYSQGAKLSLSEAIELAKSHNRSLRIDSVGISKAGQQTAISKGALLPNIGFGAQYQRYFQRPVFFGLNGSSAASERIDYARFGGEDVAAAQVSLVQPIYNASAKEQIGRNRLLEKNSRLQFQQKEIDVVAQVKQNYVRLLVLNERLKLQQESILRNKKALQDSRSLLAQGRALRVDTLRAYTLVKNLEPDVLRLTYAMQIGWQQLRNILGDISETEFVLSDSLRLNATDSLPSENGLYKLSLYQRPDLQILALNREIADKETGIYKSARQPVINFISQYQLQTQTNDFRFGRAGYPPVFFAGIQVAIPIYSGNQHVNRIALGKLDRQQADIAYTDAQEQLKTEVKQVLAALVETSERIKTQQNVSETAELSYSIVKYRYEKGVASRLELTDAEFALTTAKANYLEAVYDYLSAKIELQRIAGDH